MSSSRNLVLTLATASKAILTLVGYQRPSLWLVYLFKPLATLFLILIAFYSWARQRSAYSQWIVVGLILSLLGDVLLIWPNQYFLPGLIAFLFTHLAYLVAFTRDCKFSASPSITFLYAVMAIGIYVILFPTLPVGLRIPVAVYTAILSTMAGQAMGRFLVRQTASARWAALGALCFMASDVLLAFHRFRKPLLYSSILILVPYYFGQWLIASSTAFRRAPSQSD